MPEVLVPAKCRGCGLSFWGPKARVMHDRNSAAKAQDFLRQLQDHIKQHHEDFGKQIALGALEYQTMFTLSYYEMSDPELERQADLSRWNTHQHTLREHITDQQIADMIDRLVPDIYTLVSEGDTVHLREIMFGCMANLRDRLEEPNKYAVPAVSV